MVNHILVSRNGHSECITETDILRGCKKSEVAGPLARVLARLFPDYCNVYVDYNIAIVDDRHQNKSGYLRLTDRLSQWSKDYDANRQVSPINIFIRYTDERDISNPNVFGDTYVLGRHILDYLLTLDIVA